MIITGLERSTRSVKLEVDLKTIFASMELDVKRRLKIDSDAYLNSSNQLVCDERDWRHGSVGQDMLNPNPDEYVVYVLSNLDNLREIINKLAYES